MKVKMVLPALTEAKSPHFRPVKYSLFPPLGLATLAASEAPGLSGTVLNIGTGQRTTVNQLCAITQQALGTTLCASYEPPQPGDVLHDQADIDRAKTLLQYQPHYDLLGGLQRTIGALRLSQVAEKTVR